MILRNTKTIAIAVSALISTAAQAQDVGDMTFSAGVSTFGGNLEATYRIDPVIRLRGALMGGFAYDGTETDDDGNTYEIDANLGAIALLADYYPYNNGWRISGGLLFNNTDFSGTATASATDPIDVNGQSYDSGSLTASAKFAKEVSPMITTGYDYGFADNWMLSAEVGAIYTGGIDLDVTAGGAIPQSEVNADADYRKARNDASDLTFYPYIGITVGYRF